MHSTYAQWTTSSFSTSTVLYIWLCWGVHLQQRQYSVCTGVRNDKSTSTKLGILKQYTECLNLILLIHITHQQTEDRQKYDDSLLFSQYLLFKRVHGYYTDHSDHLLCSLCHPMRDPHNLSCEHSFCKDCIMKWLVKHLSCPECGLPLWVIYYITYIILHYILYYITPPRPDTTHTYNSSTDRRRTGIWWQLCSSVSTCFSNEWMATKPAIQKLENLLFCWLCHPMRDPHTLSYEHCFCKECIMKWLVKHFSFPECGLPLLVKDIKPAGWCDEQYRTTDQTDHNYTTLTWYYPYTTWEWDQNPGEDGLIKRCTGCRIKSHIHSFVICIFKWGQHFLKYCNDSHIG